MDRSGSLESGDTEFINSLRERSKDSIAVIRQRFEDRFVFCLAQPSVIPEQLIYPSHLPSGGLCLLL